MAARGARSRKVVEKAIEKEDAKRYADRFNSLSNTPALSRVASPVAGWRRKPSINSGSASVWSAESGDSSEQRSGHGAKKMVSKLASMVPREEDRFVAKGKPSIAPRGRGGGVPVKTVEAANDRARMRSVKSGRYVPSSMGMRPASLSTQHSEASSLRPWASTKVWAGGMNPLKSYKGFEHDDDMWMADGDCLIFFAEETAEDDPRPMCKIHARTLEQARSVFMSNLLRYGEIVVDEDEISPSITSTMQNSSWPLTDDMTRKMDEILSSNPVPGSIASQFTSRNTTITWDSEKSSMANSDRGQKMAMPQGLPHPSELEGSSITHEIWFRAPSHITRTDVQRRHHVATRNYIALLYNLPIVGSDFFEMLSDLQNVMDTYYELNDASEKWNSAQVLITYLKSRKLDDVRGNLSACLGLMAWSEQQSVKWEAGYMEGFVHAVGMMNAKTVELREFRLLSQVSRHKLQNAFNASQLRLIEAEERLTNFDFTELWYAEGVAPTQPAQRAYDEFRSFLNCFYATVWGDWPPKERDHQKHWLSRTVVNRLQADLGALYDYIVDRHVTWDVNEERHTRKWQMISNSAFDSSSFSADMPGLPITNMLVGFDTSLRYDHIPYPFPLLPSSAPIIKSKPSRKGLFSRKTTPKDVPVVAGPKEQFQMALAFNAATNVDLMGTAFRENRLLDTFQHHEKSFSPSILPPREARIGRWALLYAILQVLSTLSVNVKGLKYSEKIRYFANPSLDGLPPWRITSNSRRPGESSSSAPETETAEMSDATQAMSYCWTTSQSWIGTTTTGPIAPPVESRPSSARPPAYDGPPPEGMPTIEKSSVTLPVRPMPKKSNLLETDERPLSRQQPAPPRSGMGPRLFPTIAPVGKLAEQRHAFAINHSSKLGSPLGRDRGNAFAANTRRIP